MADAAYIARRGQIESYFDRTAAEAWSRLTSDAPVGHIRATVRAGRERMRRTLLGFLPQDLHGARVLDAGCGTGALAVDAARRGAHVTAIDISPTLIRLARERSPEDLGGGRIDFRVGDMLEPGQGSWDYMVAMDSLIHYRPEEAVGILANLSARTSRALLFTFPPRTPALALMHAAGRLFPRSDRAPAIEPVAPRSLHRLVADAPGLRGWRIGRGERVATSFYISQAQELVRA